VTGGLSIEDFRKSTTRAVKSPVYPFKLKLPEFLTEEVEEEVTTAYKTSLDATMLDSDQDAVLDVASDDDVVENTNLNSPAIKRIEECDEDEYIDEDELDPEE
jgi:hypothetical protein